MAQHFKQLGRRQQKPPMYLAPTALVLDAKHVEDASPCVHSRHGDACFYSFRTEN